jgi:glyoxylate reductase
MKKPRVYVTRPEPQEAIDLLKSKTEAKIRMEKGIVTRETFVKEISGVDAIICHFGDPIDADILQMNKNLKLIHVSTMTLDPDTYKQHGLDFDLLNKLGIYLTNAPTDEVAEAIADFTIAMMLAVSRRIVEADKFVRQGGWYKEFEHTGPIAYSPVDWLGPGMFKRTLGILGLGRIGRRVARRAKGFNMRVLYYDAVRQKPIEDVLGIEFTDMDTLLKESDFVTLHTPGIHNIIGKREIGLMKRSAYIVNTARGNNIDLKALAEALQSGQIAGAALDVYEQEPLNPDSPLVKMRNIVLSPHSSGGSLESRIQMVAVAIENMYAALEGRKPPNLVNVGVLERR